LSRNQPESTIPLTVTFEPLAASRSAILSKFTSTPAAPAELPASKRVSASKRPRLISSKITCSMIRHPRKERSEEVLAGESPDQQSLEQ